jgi:membrane-associated phospholipid phosphatase
MAVTLPARSSVRLAAEPLRPVDLILAAYLIVVSVVAAARLPDNSGGWWLLLAHALFAALLFLITRPGLGPVGKTLREIYPLLLLPALYSELDVLNSGSGRLYDALVQRWELLVFGGQISREWWQSAPSRFWSTTFHAAYLSYYLIISAPALYFAWRGDLQAVRRFVLVVIATFVPCYLAFIFFPVAGPYYQFAWPDSWFISNLPARLTYEALATGSSYGAAFPSSHVAAAVAATLAAARSSRRLGMVLLIPTMLMTVGVVYCQMHYGVDALAGLMVGLTVTYLVSKSVSGNSEKRERGGSHGR